MKRLLLTAIFARPAYAHAEGRWIQESDVQRPELQELNSDRVKIITDQRFCTQYVFIQQYSAGVAIIPRIDQNGKPAIALRCTPTDPNPKGKD